MSHRQRPRCPLPHLQNLSCSHCILDVELLKFLDVEDGARRRAIVSKPALNISPAMEGKVGLLPFSILTPDGVRGEQVRALYRGDGDLDGGKSVQYVASACWLLWRSKRPSSKWQSCFRDGIVMSTLLRIHTLRSTSLEYMFTVGSDRKIFSSSDLL